MKRLVLIIAVAFSGSILLSAQEPAEKEIRKARKTEKKQERIDKRDTQFQITKLILNDKDFVLEAHTLSTRYGDRIPVSSTLNFIHVDSAEAVIQTGSDFGAGYNGVGGVTAQGTITDWEMDVNEKKQIFRIKMNVLTQIGSWDVFMDIDAEGNSRATLYGMRGQSITYNGRILPTGESVAYQGYNTY